MVFFFFPSFVLAVANNGSRVGWQNKIGHPAHCYGQLMQVLMLSARGKHMVSKACVIVFLGLCSEPVDILSELWFEKKTNK